MTQNPKGSLLNTTGTVFMLSLISTLVFSVSSYMRLILCICKPDALLQSHLCFHTLVL